MSQAGRVADIEVVELRAEIVGGLRPWIIEPHLDGDIFWNRRLGNERAGKDQRALGQVPRPPRPPPMQNVGRTENLLDRFAIDDLKQGSAARTIEDHLANGLFETAVHS